MQPKTQPAEGTVVAPSAARKLCRVCARWFHYSPLYVWPDYCPSCVHSTSRRRHAASVDGRSLAPSPVGQLLGDEVEPLLSSNIAGALGVEET